MTGLRQRVFLSPESCLLLILFSVFVYNTATQGEICSCFRSYFSGNKMKRGGGHDPERRSIKLYKKKRQQQKLTLSKHLPLESYSQAVTIHHHHFVYMYHVSRCRYRLSTPPNLILQYFCGLKPAIMFIDHFYFQLLKQKVSMDPVQSGGSMDPGSMDPGSMFCVHVTNQNDWLTQNLSLSLSLKL